MKNLETIDDDLDLEGVIMVRLADENGNVADQYSLGNGIYIFCEIDILLTMYQYLLYNFEIFF